MQLSNKVYDVLKWITLILLPAVSAAYFALAALLHLPGSAEVVGVIAIIMTFSGSVLGFSTKSYNKIEPNVDGIMHVDTSDPDKDVFSFELFEAPEGFPDKDSLTFKVSKPSS